MTRQTKRPTARRMHKYVFVLLGVWLLFAATATIACFRVSHAKKFALYHFYLKTFPLEDNLEKL